jgi:hypothetical protein
MMHRFIKFLFAVVRPSESVNYLAEVNVVTDLLVGVASHSQFLGASIVLFGICITDARWCTVTM